MKGPFVRLIPFFVTVALAAALIVFASRHSWSDSATTWALVAVFAGSTIIDLVVARLRERATRSRARRRPTPRT